MSCVVVYVQSSDGTERVEWLKSGHWGDRWIKTQVETSDKTAEYRVGFCYKISSMSSRKSSAVKSSATINSSVKRVKPAVASRI